MEAGTTTSTSHIGATAFLGLEIGSSSSGSGFGGFGGQSSTSGVTIAGVLSGSPAANAGLAAGDEITSVGGHSVSAAKDISQALVNYHPSDSITISWLDASGQSHTATMTLTTGPAA
jgi:S1-C subfamily serine protease